jgi:hypothetical protein
VEVFEFITITASQIAVFRELDHKFELSGFPIRGSRMMEVTALESGLEDGPKGRQPLFA